MKRSLKETIEFIESVTTASMNRMTAFTICAKLMSRENFMTWNIFKRIWPLCHKKGKV